jgi:hypothetical protein
MGNRTFAAEYSFFLCSVFLCLLQCAGSPTMAGGVETTNGLTVVVSGLTVRGTAPAGSVISMLPDTFNPVSGTGKTFPQSPSADSGMAFSFSQIRDTGSYTVFAINSSTHKGARVASLHVVPGVYDSIVVPFDTLGEIHGRALQVIMSDTLVLGALDLYLEGSNFYTRSDSAGYYKMSNIPLGKYQVKLTIQHSTLTGDNEFKIVQVAELSDQNIAVTLNFIVH